MISLNAFNSLHEKCKWTEFTCGQDVSVFRKKSEEDYIIQFYLSFAKMIGVEI